MKLKITSFFTLVFLMTTTLEAQDIHYTLFNFNPLIMNPAISGAYEGTARIGGIYRNQASTGLFSSGGFDTPSFFVDAPILMVGKRDWLGVGVSFFQDNAGSLDQVTSSFQISGAFHHALDKKSNTILTLGVQWGQLTRRIDANNATTDNSISSGSPASDQDITNLADTDDTNGNDINVGLYLRSKVNKTTDYNLGLSFRHLTNPNLSLLNAGNRDDGELSLRIIAHGELNMAINDKWGIHPTAYFSNLSPANQFQLQGWGSYRLNEEKAITLRFGLGYRVGDAGQLLLGVDYKDLRVGLAYDATLSSMRDINGGTGALEIAANYIIKIFKKPDVKPQILCPTL